MLPHITEDQFYILKTRFEEAKQNQYSYIDKRVIPLVDTLGAMQDIVPIWSCSGHAPGEEKNEDDSGHVIFALKPGESSTVIKLMQFLAKDLTTEMWINLRPVLTLINLQWAFPDFEDLDKPISYPCWELEFFGSSRITNHSLQQQFFEAIKNCLNKD